MLDSTLLFLEKRNWVRTAIYPPHRCHLPIFALLCRHLWGKSNNIHKNIVPELIRKYFIWKYSKFESGSEGVGVTFDVGTFRAHLHVHEYHRCRHARPHYHWESKFLSPWNNSMETLVTTCRSQRYPSVFNSSPGGDCTRKTTARYRKGRTMLHVDLPAEGVQIKLGHDLVRVQGGRKEDDYRWCDGMKTLASHALDDGRRRNGCYLEGWWLTGREQTSAVWECNAKWACR